MKNKTRQVAIAALVLAACGLMAWVEKVLLPSYPVKSLLRIAVFTGTVGLYAVIFRDKIPLRIFRRPAWREYLPAAALAAGVLAVILGGYAVLAPWLDLSAITGIVGGEEGITTEVYPLVAVYVTFGNSLLEEFFFRGFAFLTLREAGGGKFAWVFSALAFALYHMTIVDGWFHPALLALATAGLAAGGLIFAALDRAGSIWPGWLVHMAADFALNVIGFHLFGIL